MPKARFKGSRSISVAVRFAKTAARFRRELIEKYGEEKGRKIRFAEAFGLSEYGAQPTLELEKALFDL